MEEVIFENILTRTLEELKKAEKSILISMRWFTNVEIFETLCAKLRNGLKIEIVIFDDIINNNEFGLQFQTFINLGGELRFSTLDNQINHRFVLIDDQILITGTYDWTYFSEYYSKENVIFFKGNANLISKFQIEFKNIFRKLPKNPSVNLKQLFDLKNISRDFDYRYYLGIDQYYQSIELSETFRNDIAMRLLSGYEFSNSIKTEVKLIKTITTSLGIESKLDGIDGRFSILIKKGDAIPILKTNTYYTTHDYQNMFDLKIFKGENDYVSENILIGNIEVQGLKPKPAGLSSVTLTFEISEDSTLKIRAVNNDTNSYFSGQFKIENLIF